MRCAPIRDVRGALKRAVSRPSRVRVRAKARERFSSPVPDLAAIPLCCRPTRPVTSTRRTTASPIAAPHTSIRVQPCCFSRTRPSGRTASGTLCQARRWHVPSRLPSAIWRPRRSISMRPTRTLFASGNHAFNDMASYMTGTIDMGMPFFYGRHVDYAISGTTSAGGGTGPYDVFTSS